MEVDPMFGEVSQRIVGWFSCGDASAVACALTLKERPDAVIARIVIPDEHEDADRFHADCERWYGRQILRLQDPEKRSIYDVFEKRRYIAGIAGAPCTGELKKAVRFRFQQPDDIHIMGYTIDEQTLAARILDGTARKRSGNRSIPARIATGPVLGLTFVRPQKPSDNGTKGSGSSPQHIKPIRPI
jgi:hypothetical protein